MHLSADKIFEPPLKTVSNLEPLLVQNGDENKYIT